MNNENSIIPLVFLQGVTKHTRHTHCARPAHYFPVKIRPKLFFSIILGLETSKLPSH